jgi:fibronectin type 3 domain-containing protein
MKKLHFLAVITIILLILGSCYIDMGVKAETDDDFPIFVLPPYSPKDVTATVESSDSIKISWTAVSNAAGYNIYRSLYYNGGRDDNSYKKIITTASTSYIDTGLLADTIYNYKVSAFNDGGEGSQSIYVSVRSYPAVPTIAPTGVTASALSSSSIRIDWTGITGFSKYMVYRSLTESGDYNEINLVSSFDSKVSYTDASLFPEETYYYKIAANNISGADPQSAAVSVTTLDVNPRAPESVSATTASYSSILVKWSSGPNAEEYKVYRSLNSLSGYTYITSSSSTSYIDRGLDVNTLYYYKISGVNIHGESELSTLYKSATTLAAGAGTNRANAIEIATSLCGDFPEGMNEVWYQFTRIGAGTLYADDKTAENSIYTGDIAVDVTLDNDLIYLTINGRPLFNINIGRGSTDSNRIQASNWSDTYYVKVKPFSNSNSNKGTFVLYFTPNLW